MTLRSRIASSCEHVGQPLVRQGTVSVEGFDLPTSYSSLLEVANGFVLERSRFRLFGIQTESRSMDVHEWNQSPWVAEYGGLAKGLVFFAEDIFGDQYAFRFGFSGKECDLVKFWCEGGEVQRLGDASSLEAWLAEEVVSDDPSFLDRHLAEAAFEEDLRPSEKEHLSFILPLITGGRAELENLEVLNGVFHLHLLGQLTLKNLKLPDGQRIARFWSEH